MSYLRFAALCLWVSMAVSLAAQVDTGTIAGTVTDPSGAVLAGVSVTVRNTETNETYQAVTDPSGVYATPPLKPGRYSVTARLQGFKTAVHDGITVLVQQRAVVDIKMELGAVAEQVLVTGEAPLVESETSALGQVVDSRAMVDAPLNGRNYLNLALFSPAVLPAMPGARGEGDFNANGNRSLQNNFLLDGIDNNSRIVDLQSGSSQVVTPSLDAIREFKIQTSQYSAEFGRAAGGVVNVAIKSGTNQFHGSAFEFLRNDAFDARNFFAQDTPKLTYNQFGATFGGPVRRDRTFFFASWQGTRQRRGETLSGTVPTADMRRGIFNTTPQLRTIYDPLTTWPDPARPGGVIRTAFPNGAIPRERWDPVAAKLNDLWPAPNIRGKESTILDNFISNPVARDTRDQHDWRVDHNFSSRDKIFGRFSLFQLDGLRPAIFYPSVLDGSPNFEYTEREDTARSLAVSETHIFSPSVVGEFRFGWNRVRDDRLPIVKEDVNEQFGIKGIPKLEGVTGLPRISIGRVTAIGGAGFTPNFKLSQTFQYSGNLSLIRGPHSIKMGANLLVVQSDFGISSQARGNLTFNGIFTARDERTTANTQGEGYADFLLGLVGAAQLTSFNSGKLRGRNYELFFQDDWKATRRLTINWGARYEVATPVVERDNRQANFDLAALRLRYANKGSLYERALLHTDTNNFSPRLGLAYKLTRRLVLRSGYGVFFANYDSLGASGRLVSNPPFFFNRNYPNDRIAPSFLLRDGFPERASAPAFNVQSWDERLVLPYSQQWSMDLQFELTPNLLVEAGYTGNKGTKYQSGRNANNPRPGAGGAQSRRPLANYIIPDTDGLLLGEINRQEPYGVSNYHAFTLKVQKRYARGLQFLAAYTFSKAIDLGSTPLDRGDAGIQDHTNIRAERALASFHATNRLTFSHSWDLPFGKGKRWLSDAPGFANHLLGGWQFTGITTMMSGRPFSPGYLSNVAGTGAYRPNRVCDGNLPRGRRSVDRWFDPDCFQPSVLYTFGNSGRNVLFNPGAINFDLSLQKNFALGDRFRLNFRSEFFNAFNTPHFLGDQFGGSGGFATVGGAQVARITAASDPRVIQLGLKLLF